MSDVVNFRLSKLPPDPPDRTPGKFGNDACWLKLCAEWRVARAMQQANWAAHEAETMWGTLPDHDIELDKRPLERMQELEGILATIEPKTMLLARELLGITVTILAYSAEDPHPEATLAQGPVLDIIRNVVNSLEYCKAEMRIGPKRRMRD